MTWRRSWLQWRTRKEREQLEGEVAAALARGDFAAAASSGRRSVGLLTEAFGPDHVEVGVGRYALAVALLGAGDAEAAGTEALAAQALLGGLPPEAAAPSPAAVLEVLVGAADRRGDTEALVAHGRALVASIEGEAHGEARDLRLATASTRLGLALARAGRADEAWSHLARALVLRRARLGAGSLQLGEALHNVATHRLGGSSLDEAAIRFEEAVRIARAAGEAGVSLLEAALHNLGSLREEQGRDDEARAAWEAALAARQERLGMEDPSLRPTLVRLARLRERTGSTLQAGVLFERAAALARRELGDEHEVSRALAAWRAGALSGGEAS